MVDNQQRIIKFDLNINTGITSNVQISSPLSFYNNYSLNNAASRVADAKGWDWFIFGVSNQVTVQS